ncbi:tRNA pseudouridine(65) synthase TruC [Glaciecola petra]|uniref:tRNA pseudouridine synthase C n=1 Tax=Glaciecola petra TaxID=3075602 RepID=A0ABU2ZMQ5_9ALTE|nr:tRNA pseudouridine(65) synthase TruC [Aestuariibacter sp. P117]MDT0593690.1 tRNA pseudouridine(65) synthase TruC [Aestuariibacter sp. P117]
MLKIIYQDDDIVAVHKPSGMLVHKSKIDRHETVFLLQVLRDQIGQYVYPIHRLDKPTSGIILFGLNPKIAKALSQAFVSKQIEKSYIAVVRGFVNDQIIDYPLKEVLDKMTDAKAQKDKAAQDAITSLETLAYLEFDSPLGKHQTARFSLVKLLPKTGRKHQLRRHMAHIRHPIIGDTTHGDGKQNRYAIQHLQIKRLALVAKDIKFKHPNSDTLLNLATNLDEDLRFVLSLFKYQH